jgi:hypothetical protein
MRRPVVLAVVLACIVAIASTVGILRDDAPGNDRAATVGTTSEAEQPGTDDAESEARGGSEEADLEQQETAERLQAFADARANGTFGTPFVATTTPTAGWTGSRLLNPATDDWEPAVAADPHAPYV